MKFRWSYVFLILTLATLTFTGLDFTHHAHNAWLYNQMFANWDFMSTDPYFSSQITYAYGVPAYSIAGLLWFIFSIHSVKIILALTVIVNYIILRKWFKDSDKWISMLIVLNIFYTQYDAYVAAFSNCLFWLASYAYFNKKSWWSIPLIIAAFNHPYVLVSSLFFAVGTPILIIPLGIIMSYFIVAQQLFTDSIYIPVYTILMGIGRSVYNLLPILVLVSKDKIKLLHFKAIKYFVKLKMSIPQVLALLLLVLPLAVTIVIYVLVYQPPSNVSFSMYDGMPSLNGTLKVVDYIYLPSVYILPFEGYTLYEGSFRENNPQHMVKTTWANTTEYANSLIEENISYVLFCKMCNPQSNEKEMLDSLYNVTWQNDYYYLYDVR